MNIEQQSINAIRVLSVESIQKANSGHPGLPLGGAPMAYTLWANVMNHNPKNPNWINRDRFILSAGHGSAMLYSMLHLFGYGLKIEDLENFRQMGSLTPGHPEYGHTVGVEATTGPLGQGISNGVGMAMAEAHLASHFNRDGHNIIDHYTYLICGDGDLMEGISYEAASLAGTLGLGKLIVLYDSNSITIEGGTDIAFSEDTSKRFEALGWEVIQVDDGNDIQAIEEAVLKAKKSLDRPTLVKITTEIGYGTAKQGKSSAHGEPLGLENIVEMKKFFAWEEEGFNVPSEVYKHMDTIISKGQAMESEWDEKFAAYEAAYPELGKELKSWLDGDLPMDYLNSEEYYEFEKDYATRESSGLIINRLAEKMPNLIGGSADLGPSNKTTMTSRESFSKDNYKGSNIHFGVREHAMAGISNGMALHGGLKAYCATFLIFSDYMKGSMRLSALMNLPVTYVLTHDSIGVGEDGPTHQPIEQMAMLRSIPNFVDFRPADARETAAGWKLAMVRKTGPVGLALSRQKLPNLEGTGENALKGAYILKEAEGKLDTILIASGSEVNLAYEAAKELEAKGIGTRLVSIPSFTLFEEQSEEYKELVLPRAVRKRVGIEAAGPMGWYKYIGLDGRLICMEGFGASAPGGELFAKFNFTVENIVKTALSL